MQFVYKPTYTRKGRTKKVRSWWGCYRLDGDSGQPVRLSLGTTDKRVAEKKLAELVRRAEHERAGIAIADPLRQAAMRPLADHLGDFVADLRVKGCDDEYIRHVEARTRSLMRHCGWEMPKDVNADSFLRWRREVSPKSPRTLNHYYDAVRALMNWMQRTGRIAEDPLKSVEKVPAKNRGTFKRRALTDEQVGRLLSVAGMHRLVYLLAVTLGLRHGELRKLRRSDVVLDGAKLLLHVRADVAKNGTASVIELDQLPMVVSELRAWLAQAPQGDGCLFWRGVPSHKTWRAHFEAAGIPRLDESGMRKADFHALRATTCTNLHRAKVPLPVAQKIMRHKDIRHTAETYADVEALDVPGAFAALGGFVRAGEEAVLVAGLAHDPVAEGRVVPRRGTEDANPMDAKCPEKQRKKGCLARRDTGGHSMAEEWSRGESNPRPDAAGRAPLRV